jgi:lipopolysaccharide O-acetyltransferase
MEPPRQRALVTAPVKIGDRVWLGENVVVLSGVSIGAGSIIGANSVVTKDVASNTICAGVPARLIRKYNDEPGCWEHSRGMTTE